MELLKLSVGSHKAGSGQGCAMNVISWENGDKEITDFPSCADRFLALVVQRVNDTFCTHKDGSLLCAPCSIEVLALAHRTTGTNINDKLTAAERTAIYAKIAREQADSVAHSLTIDAGGANAAAIAADVAASYAATTAVTAIDTIKAVNGAAANGACAVEYAASDKTTQHIERAHQVIDRFIELAGIETPKPVAPAVTEQAIQNMLVKS